MGGKSSKDKNSAEPQLIVVFGATGMQGGSVVRAMKGDDKFKVRAVTRNVESEKAKALADEGIEVVQADLDDLESLNAAVKGAHGVFMLTNYWDHMSGEKELQQGKNITDACVEQKVQFVVASLLEDVKAQIGKDCPHFDNKARIEEYIKEKGVPFCSVRLAGYMENFLGLMKPRKVEEGQYILDIPMGDAPMDLVCASECGECIHQIFLNQSKYKNKDVGLSSDKITVARMAEILTKHLEGKEFKATEMTTEQLEASGEPMSAELAAMFEFYIKGKFTRDIALTKKLNSKIPDLDKWVTDNKEALEQALE